MKKYNINLDDYFDKAKQTTSLLTKDEARNLIEGGETVSNSKTTSKGISKMNIIMSAVAATAIVGAITIGNVFNKDTEIIELFNKNTAINNEHFDESLSKINLENTTALALIENNSIENKLYAKYYNTNNTTQSEKSLVSPIEVKGVNIIELNDADMEKIGIKRNGNNFEFFGLKDTEHPVEITLSSNKISVVPTSKGNFDENSPIAGISPKFVTDKNGNRLLSMFSIEDYGGAFIVMLRTNATIDHHFIIENNKIVTSDLLKEEINKLIQSNLGNLDSLLQNLSNKDVFKMQLENNINPSISIDNLNNSELATQNPISIVEQTLLIPKVRNIEIDRADNPNGNIIVSRHQASKMDSILFELPQINLGFIDMQNINITEMNATDMSKNKMKIIHKRIDSKRNDSTDIDRLISNSNQDALKDFGLNINVLNENIDEDMKRINKLVPIGIGLEKGEIDYILWFDATVEFALNLPKEIKESILPELQAIEEQDDICNISSVVTGDKYFDVWRACSGAVENLSVFPNPASDNINLSYNLTEQRNISVSIHDLFGNRIIELKIGMKPNGMHTESFKLIDFQPGMYLIVIQTDKQETAVQRFIVN